MSYPSTDDPAFRARIAHWIAERHEILALIRRSHAAGSRDFEFFDSVEAFDAMLRGLPPRTCVTVFRERQLSLRGRVDDDFIRQALSLVPDGRRAISLVPYGTEFLLVGLEQVKYGEYVRYYHHYAGETSAELREELEEMRGQQVALGPYPPWLEDGEDVISAVVPNPDGSVTTGVY